MSNTTKENLTKVVLGFEQFSLLMLGNPIVIDGVLIQRELTYGSLEDQIENIKDFAEKELGEDRDLL